MRDHLSVIPSNHKEDIDKKVSEINLVLSCLAKELQSTDDERFIQTYVYIIKECRIIFSDK